MSPNHLLTRAVSASGVVVSPYCISVLPVKGDVKHGEVAGAARASISPAFPCRVSPRAALLLAARSCCPQATNEEVTGSCLTLPLQVEPRKEAEGQQDAGGLCGSLQAVMCQLDLCATSRVQEAIAVHSFPNSSQQGSGQQVSMTSVLPPHPKIQGRAPRAQRSPSGVLQAMTGDLPPQKESASSSSARILLQGQPGPARE